MQQQAAVTLDQCVERFEAACQQGAARIVVGDFLPDESHPQYSTIAVELFRVDLEYRFRGEDPPEVEDYLKQFPLVFVSDSEIRDLAFEHYRLRLASGDTVNADEYSSRFKIDTSTWRVRTSTVRRGSLSRLDESELQPGMVFENFELIEEIGRGAMARVFLATQSGIADRQVVLKFSEERSLEVNRLGRLQHTNIVPILSVHPYGEGSAICMPFLGTSTLDEVLSSSGAVDPVQLAVDLVSGLKHAHARGVLHRDIKPANILLADDSRAMLLDFNLSDDLRDETQSVIGGTPQYMSPEQQEAFRSLTGLQRPDHRSDIYSVGAVLFEAVTGTKPAPDVLVAEGSPALGAIINRCLRSEPHERYQSAANLLEDLCRHRDNLPLRHQAEPSIRERLSKWAKRHPRLSSSGSLFCIFAVVLAMAGGAWLKQSREVQSFETITRFAEAQEELVEVRSLLALVDSDLGGTDEGIERGERLLQQLSSDNRFQLLPADDLQTRTEAVGELLYYLAQATHRTSRLAGHAGTDELAAKSRNYNQRAVDWFTSELGAVPAAVRKQTARFESTSIDQEAVGESRLDRLLLAVEYNQSAQFDECLAHLDAVKSEFASDVSLWNLMGSAHAGKKQFSEAETCFTACIAFKPESWIAWCNRGLTRMGQQKFSLAEQDFDEVIKLRPKHWSGYFNRALARGRVKRYADAVEDLVRAEELAGPSRILFLRARYRLASGDRENAMADHRKGLQTVPTDAKSWVSRGIAKLGKHPEQALADFQAALKAQSDSVDGLRNIAHVLSERMDRPEEAIDALTRIIDAGVDDPAAYGGRAVLFARSGDSEEAIMDARQSLKLADDAQNCYQNACVFALLSKADPKHAATAITLLARAFEADQSLIEYANRDTDLSHLRTTSDYRSLVEASQTVHRLKSESKY